jgi:uncharacterized protein YndB with AHSA1/START domain
MSKTITQTMFYKHPAADVWDYLTRPELIEQWLMKNDFEPTVGHEFTFTTRPLPQFDFDGVMNCKVLEVAPCKKLSYTWKGGNEGRITLDSVVVWTLTEKNGGTELRLEHTGFTEANVAAFGAMNDGWYRNIRKIDELLNVKKNGNTNA